MNSKQVSYLRRIAISAIGVLMVLSAQESLAMCKGYCEPIEPVEPSGPVKPKVPMQKVPATHFVVGTYNIHGGSNAQGVMNPDNTAAEIYTDLTFAGAEVVVLQEVPENDPSLFNRVLDSSLIGGATLRQLYPYNYYRSADLAILSKWPLAKTWTMQSASVYKYWPDVAPKQNLVTITAEIASPQGNFMVYDVHLQNNGHNFFGEVHKRPIDRLVQSKDIVDDIKRRNTGNLPVVVIGDMNDSETDWSMGHFSLFLNGPTKADYVNYNAYGHHYDDGLYHEDGGAIDYAFSSPGSHTEQIITFDGMRASDHAPALFIWRK